MRRIASLGLLLALAGCGQYGGQFVGNPTSGMGGFIADTHNVVRNPNSLSDGSDNVLRVLGQDDNTKPLEPEPGNIWPGPLPPQKTLEDLERNPDALLKPGEEIDLHPTNGSSTPPGSVQPSTVLPSAAPAPMPAPRPVSQSAPKSSTVQTPGGTAVLNQGSGTSVQTYTDPKGGTGLMVPNGNGTSTMIAPDGSVQTVPSPK
jgi:hypothetical protein